MCISIYLSIHENKNMYSTVRFNRAYYLNSIFQYDNAIWCLSYIHANIESNVPTRNYNIDEQHCTQLTYAFYH